MLDVSDAVQYLHSGHYEAGGSLEAGGEEVGVKFKWILLSSITGGKSWEGGCSEAKEIVVTSAIFADDTTFADKAKELVKKERGRWEERNSEDKEKRLEFGTGEGEKIRIRMLDRELGGREQHWIGYR